MGMLQQIWCVGGAISAPIALYIARRECLKLDRLNGHAPASTGEVVSAFPMACFIGFILGPIAALGLLAHYLLIIRPKLSLLSDPEGKESGK